MGTNPAEQNRIVGVLDEQGFGFIGIIQDMQPIGPVSLPDGQPAGHQLTIAVLGTNSVLRIKAPWSAAYQIGAQFRFNLQPWPPKD